MSLVQSLFLQCPSTATVSFLLLLEFCFIYLCLTKVQYMRLHQILSSQGWWHWESITGPTTHVISTSYTQLCELFANMMVPLWYILIHINWMTTLKYVIQVLLMKMSVHPSLRWPTTAVAGVVTGVTMATAGVAAAATMTAAVPQPPHYIYILSCCSTSSAPPIIFQQLSCPLTHSIGNKKMYKYIYKTVWIKTTYKLQVLVILGVL